MHTASAPPPASPHPLTRSEYWIVGHGAWRRTPPISQEMVEPDRGGRVTSSSEPLDTETWELFTELSRRAQAAGLQVVDETHDDENPHVSIQVPSGRKTRPVQVTRERLPLFESVRFESVRLLGDYGAVLDTDSGYIEARVIPSAREPARWLLRRIPGATAIPRGIAASAGSDEGESEGREEEALQEWQLRVESGSAWIEVSPATPLFNAFSELWYASVLTVKLPCPVPVTHDEALTRLENLSSSFFFDLDLRYGVAFELGKVRAFQRPRRADRSTNPPQYPNNNYAREPLALYRYGRSARGLPLLEFLAYYQALEYYFPVFTREQVLGRLRAEVVDPRFDPDDEQSISRLVRIASTATRTANEREQVRATIMACADADTIRGMITSDDSTKDHFCANKQPVKGVKKIQLSGDVDLRHQVADRIYDIRCRIVHAKQDGGEPGVELLLPTSDEAAALGPDIDLVRAMAQRAIVSRARRANPQQT